MLSDEQRVAALTFAIVGAGPTGVECCAELRDFIEEVTRCPYSACMSIHSSDPSFPWGVMGSIAFRLFVVDVVEE